jgi:CP family cyanate transporter-like MFS transporter
MTSLSSPETTDTNLAPNPYRWTMLAGMWSIYFCFSLIVVSTAPLVKPIVEDLGLSLSAMGSLMGAWPLLYIAAAIPAGAFLDRFGVRRALLIAAVIMASSALLRANATGYVSMFIAIALFGVGGPLISVGAPKLISAWFSGRERGLAMGIYITGPSLGGIAALALTNSVFMPLTGNDWRAVLQIYTLITLCAGFIWFLISRPAKARVDENVSGRASLSEQIQIFSGLLAMPSVRLVLVMGIGIFAFNHGLNNWLPEILRRGGMSSVQAGYWAALPTAVGVVGALVLPRFATPERRQPMLVGLLLTAAVAAFMINVASGGALAIGLCLQGTARSALMPILMLLLMESEEVGSRNMGAAGGLFFSAAEMGGVLGPLSIGVVADLSGGFTLPLASLSLLATGLALLGFRLRHLLHPVTKQ